MPLRFRRLLEGVSLWLLVVLFLSLHPMYAEATESWKNTAGALYYGEHGRRGEHATPLSADYPVALNVLSPSAAVFHEHWQEEGYLRALLVPGIERGERLTREFVLVSNCPGLMACQSIPQLQTALMRGLDTGRRVHL